MMKRKLAFEINERDNFGKKLLVYWDKISLHISFFNVITERYRDKLKKVKNSLSNDIQQGKQITRNGPENAMTL